MNLAPVHGREEEVPAGISGRMEYFHHPFGAFLALQVGNEAERMQDANRGLQRLRSLLKMRGRSFEG
jgi:hypothetical protein